MNNKYALNRNAINRLPPRQWEGYDSMRLANLSNESAWEVVREFPACVGQIPNATANMQAYALVSRGTLLFESVSWLIDTELVAPGSTSWALHFAADYSKYRDDCTPRGQYFRMVTLEESWSELQPMARFAPGALPQNLRQLIADAPYSLLRQFIGESKKLNKLRRTAAVGV
jgi:hypothetical protein